MHKNFLFILWLFFCVVANAQEGEKGNTYAVIVGISKYQNSGIRELRFANRDAQMFAAYLQSKAGGAVPQDNIRLLLDSTATNAAVYDALSWLKDNAKPNDLVYFYFSGHGDMETETIRKLGFLLTYNTPRTNYINNAIRVEDLNYYANTLSAQSKAKVILITDACHSGTLVTSDYRLRFLVGDQLRTATGNEIRITSCGPNELSVENEAWGGGRGVFSYYLINALTGYADSDRNGIVTVREARNYMDSALAKDATLQQIKHKQTPALIGKDQSLLATVNWKDFEEKRTAPAPMVSLSVSPVLSTQQLMNYFFEQLTLNNPETFFDYDRLNKTANDSIVWSVLAQAKNRYANPLQRVDSSLQVADDEPITGGETSVENILLLEEKLRNSRSVSKQFRNRLLVYIDDLVQDVINEYLSGAEAELERRRYYNSRNNSYDVYPKMLALALKLTDIENPLYKNLLVKKYYTQGVAYRLKIPLYRNSEWLIDSSLQQQLQALKLEENAAYINNDLGLLYQDKGNYKKAEEFYLKATMISPMWALPWANLIQLYTSVKQFDKAKEAYKVAEELQPGFQNTFVGAGMMYEELNQWLTAEEMFRKSIQINSRHYLPYERLGYTYLKTTNYAQADSFFFEAEVRKRGYFFKAPRRMKLPKPVVDDSHILERYCDFDLNDVNANDVAGNFAWAMMAYRTNDFFTAEEKFKRVIALDKTNPLAFHYLGKLYYDHKVWQGADLMFNFSINYYRDSVSFFQYVDSLQKHTPASPVKDCVLEQFRKSYYGQINDHYFLGTLYEQWNHYTESEQQYRIIIEKQPDFFGGYYLLMNMLEKIDRYLEAETVVNTYMNVNAVNGRNELFAFYNRMRNRFPDAGIWYYKAGNLLYQMVAKNPGSYSIDFKWYKPDNKGVDSLSRVRFPVIPNEEALPGIERMMTMAARIEYPFSNGINLFLQADSLMSDDEYLLAEINDKLGDLYVWQGLVEDAPKHYQKAMNLQDRNTGIRLKLIDVLDRLYQFTSAQVHLDTLVSRNEINFSKQLLLAKYYIHSSRFKDGTLLLQQAEAIHPYQIAAIENLFGKIELLSNQPKKAIERYKIYLKLVPNDVEAMYSIARMHAREGNKKEAWRWLQTAIDKGFLYLNVLKYDAVWNTYRTNSKWKALMKNYQFIEYVAEN